MNRIITLTTDFGTQDAYVAAMKGVILGIAPEVRMIDVTHAIAPQDVMEAAFVVKNTVPYFPRGTIHLAVVDPGVGTSRHAIALQYEGQWFVGPDNGLFALVLNGTPPSHIVTLNRPAYWRTETPSATFHGRDIFAPAAAHLASGVPLTNLGSPLETLKPLLWALPISDQQGIQGWVVHVDRFGNCITNISGSLIEAYSNDRAIKGYVGTSIIPSIQPTYDVVPAGEPLMLLESNDLLEIAVNAGNASELLSIRKGSPVNLVFTDEG